MRAVISLAALGLAAILPVALQATLPAAAQEGGRPAPGGSVPACESLVALRQLSAAAGEDRSRAAAQVSGQPGCRLVPRDQIGALEHRALVGGAPYECFTVAGGACLWVMP